MHPEDTIAAISSAVGPAARMIVRSSGPAAQSIARSICDNLPPAGRARVTQLRFAGLVPAHVYLFAAPRSYTGQDLVEYHIPGNPILARMLLDALVAAGARHAEAGEFTARAYFAGRLDLAEAEGVAATVSAHGEQELRAARQLMSGELARRLRAPTDALVETLALVEAGIDFSDEDVTFLSGDEVFRRVQSIDGLLDEIVRTSARFEPLTHEPTFVLVGRPNAGKSTLLNALAGASRAVVSDAAGTTRDALSVEVPLRRGLVRLLDVAGIEQAPAQGDSPGGAVASDPSSEQHDGEPARIASLMQRHALRELEAADFVVLVSDSSDTRPPLPTPRPADLVVRTKGDVTGHRDAVSAVTGQGMDALRDRLDQLAFGATRTDDLSSSTSRPTLALNARHLHAIAEARDALSRAAEVARAGAGGELVALELRDALDALGRVLGQVTPDDVIGRIFSTFCIGK